MTGIYKITSPSGKVYIGQSRNINKRKSVYKNLKCAGQEYIYRSLKKYRFELHEFKVIHELPNDINQKDLNAYEVLYITSYSNCGAKMMNISFQDQLGKISQETRIKISGMLKEKGIVPPSRVGTKLSESHKNILINSRKGCKNSASHNKILSENAKKNCFGLRQAQQKNCKNWAVYSDGFFVGLFSPASKVAQVTGINLKNIYSMSKTGRTIAGFKIIKK